MALMSPGQITRTDAADEAYGPPEHATEPAEGPAHAAASGSSVEAGNSPAPVMLVVGNEEQGEPSESSPGMAWPLGDLAGDGALSGLLMAGGVVILMVILMGRLRRGKRASAPSDVTPRERIDAIRAQAVDRSQMEAFRVDVHEFTRRMAAMLDNKAERLERLIADADERLERLERAERSRPAPRATTPSSEPSRPPDPLHDRIYRLSDEGLNPVQIAQQTGQPTGQIELILALRV